MMRLIFGFRGKIFLYAYFMDKKTGGSFMTNLLEKSIYLGLGMFMHSREKVEELVEELVNKGK